MEDDVYFKALRNERIEKIKLHFGGFHFLSFFVSVYILAVLSFVTPVLPAFFRMLLWIFYYLWVIFFIITFLIRSIKKKYLFIGIFVSSEFFFLNFAFLYSSIIRSIFLGISFLSFIFIFLIERYYEHKSPEIIKKNKSKGIKVSLSKLPPLYRQKSWEFNLISGLFVLTSCEMGILFNRYLKKGAIGFILWMIVCFAVMLYGFYYSRELLNDKKIINQIKKPKQTMNFENKKDFKRRWLHLFQFIGLIAFLYLDMKMAFIGLVAFYLIERIIDKKWSLFKKAVGISVIVIASILSYIIVIWVVGLNNV